PDDRLPSDQDWAGRILPVGCSGTVWNEESCVVSAGHCVGADDVLQFRVPASNGNCSLNHPGPEDQFPITSRLFENNGVGGDWAVMTTGTNHIGETPYERYGMLRRIATVPPDVDDACANWGYGIDEECVRNQIQQTHDGTITDVNATNLEFDVDITFGNSGSSLLANDEIIGIVTHCTESCPPNFATRMDLPEFIAARNALCPPMSPHTFGPSAFAVQYGEIAGGGLDELLDSDDEKLVITQQAAPSPLLPVARLFLVGYAAFSPAAQMDFVIEASADALPANVPQRAELWNFQTNAFEVVDERTASTTDSTITIEITAAPDRFVRDGSNQVVAGVDWFDPGMTFFVAWHVAVDKIEWPVAP
ncbi:MAG: trypsin-like serine protease, partial [Planctomycetota bacterium]